MSCDAYEHLTRIAVELRDLDVVRCVAEQLDWRFLAEARVASCAGPGVLPPGWRYPMVIQDGLVALADFGDASGNKAGAELLTDRYAIERAKRAAAEQGFEFEEREGGLVIFQPGGVVVTVGSGGTLEINRLDLVDGDPTLYLQDALGRVVENAFEHHHAHAAEAQVHRQL